MSTPLPAILREPMVISEEGKTHTNNPKAKLWPVMLRFVNGQMPCKVTIRATSAKQALEFALARHPWADPFASSVIEDADTPLVPRPITRAVPQPEPKPTPEPDPMPAAVKTAPAESDTIWLADWRKERGATYAQASGLMRELHIKPVEKRHPGYRKWAKALTLADAKDLEVALEGARARGEIPPAAPPEAKPTPATKALDPTPIPEPEPPEVSPPLPQAEPHPSWRLGPAPLVQAIAELSVLESQRPMLLHHRDLGWVHAPNGISEGLHQAFTHFAPLPDLVLTQS